MSSSSVRYIAEWISIFLYRCISFMHSSMDRQRIERQPIILTKRYKSKLASHHFDKDPRKKWKERGSLKGVWNNIKKGRGEKKEGKIIRISFSSERNDKNKGKAMMVVFRFVFGSLVFLSWTSSLALLTVDRLSSERIRLCSFLFCTILFSSFPLFQCFLSYPQSSLLR